MSNERTPKQVEKLTKIQELLTEVAHASLVVYNEINEPSFSGAANLLSFCDEIDDMMSVLRRAQRLMRDEMRHVEA